jgi:carbamoyltransferase
VTSVTTPPATARTARESWESRILDVQDFDKDVFVADVQRQPVAWVDGDAEVGPRALGHRSLLGDPRRMATKDFLNQVKPGSATWNRCWPGR